MNDLKLICETIWYDKYKWSEDFEAFFEWFDEIDECVLIFNEEFIKYLVKYLDKKDIYVWWPCDDNELNIRATISYKDPVKFLLNILI